MKDFWDKYIFEVAIGITFFVGAAIYKIINWFLKIKIFKPVEEINKSILELDKVSKFLVDSLKEYKHELENSNRMLDASKEDRDNFKQEVHNNIERAISSIGELSIQVDDLRTDIKEVRAEVIAQGKELNKLKGEHTAFHSKHK